MRPSFRLNRRTFLRGVGGVAIGLPVLEVMLDGHGESLAQEAGPIPKRYLVCFGGTSLGADDDPLHNDYVPDTVGPGYELKSALAPFADHDDVQREITVVSGLYIPEANGGETPPGGRADDFHTQSLGPLFSGVRSTDNRVEGPSSDQIVADAIAGDTTFKSLVYRVQASWYLTGSEPVIRDLMSYRYDGNGDLISLPATVSPKAAYDALFFNFAPPDLADAAELDFRLRARQSVIDIVRGNTERLVARLGRADKRRLERHLDELRDLERRIGSLPPVAEGQCEKPGDPGSDPALGNPQGRDGEENTYDQNLGYSDEDARARIFCDLVHMAFTCDLSRAGSLMFTMAQSHLNMYPITGQATDLHEVGHNGVSGGTMAVSEAIAWHMKHFGYLVAKLRDTPEGKGSLLDSSALVFLHEGGHGLDTSDTSGETIHSAHSTENMACLVAGRAGGLKAGHHVVAEGRHPANVLISAMRAVGVDSELGEVSGHIDDLFV